MGNSQTEKKQVAVTGLQNAGKKTIFNQIALHSGDKFTTIFSKSIQPEAIEIGGFCFKVWDTVAEEDKNRMFWQIRFYYRTSKALIFVIDSNDENVQAMNAAKKEFNDILNGDAFAENIPILVFATKNDLPFMITCEEIAEMFQILNVKKELDAKRKNTKLMIVNEIESYLKLLFIDDIFSSHLDIIHLIVQYLPSVRILGEINNHKCCVQSCSGVTGDGIVQGIEWLSSFFPDSKKSCILQ